MTDKTKGENDAADNDESDFKSGVSRRDITVSYTHLTLPTKA